MAYTNTVALKGDVTRTGRRNVKGVINDGAASLMRLYHVGDGYMVALSIFRIRLLLMAMTSSRHRITFATGSVRLWSTLFSAILVSKRLLVKVPQKEQQTHITKMMC